ncbi:MAG: helix-turn-helix transcriptional regulator [Alphaproteobacteria bacterium]
MAEDQVHPIDRYVGSRIKWRRKMLGKTQKDLAYALELSYQQIQKYEKGSNRISSSVLWYIAQALDVDMEYFFERLPSPRTPRRAVAEERAEFKIDPLSKSDTLKLALEFERIMDPAARRKLIGIFKAIVDALIIAGPKP